MAERRQTKGLIIGAVLAAASLSAAWSIGRGTVPSGEVVTPLHLARWKSAAVETEPSGGELHATRNDKVDRWIGFLQDGNARRTKLWLERKGTYAPMISAELRRRGMPEDLVYLALIESGFSPKAYSPAKASGLWQFIAETGRRYGLEVSSEVDERRDPLKSTSAALDYLQDLHERFGSWYLAAAAYNTGENRVERVLRERAGGARGDDALFWKIAPHLPRETRDYVPLMLAAAHIAKDPEAYGFSELDYHEPLAFDTVWVPGVTDLSVVARASGVDTDAVADLNPHLTRGHTPSNRAYPVRVPVGTRLAFEARFPALYREARLARAKTPSEPRVAAVTTTKRTHRVRNGETLTAIARRYGVTLNALRSANSGIDARRLRVGAALRVPAATSSIVKVATTRSRVHRVARGENLSTIAQRYRVSVRELKRWNDLRGSRIYAGQRLRVNA